MLGKKASCYQFEWLAVKQQFVFLLLRIINLRHRQIINHTTNCLLPNSLLKGTMTKYLFEEMNERNKRSKKNTQAKPQSKRNRCNGQDGDLTTIKGQVSFYGLHTYFFVDTKHSFLSYVNVTRQ